VRREEKTLSLKESNLLHEKVFPKGSNMSKLSLKFRIRGTSSALGSLASLFTPFGHKRTNRRRWLAGHGTITQGASTFGILLARQDE
jgi:hypothetical protein